MPQTHVWGTTFASGNDRVSVPSETVTASGESIVDETIAAAASNVPVTIHVDVSALKSLLIIANAAMTVKTNSSSTPGDTLALEANVPVRWTMSSIGDCPLTVDVTALYVTSVAGGTLKMFALQDATP